MANKKTTATTDPLIIRLQFARTLNNLAQDAADRYQPDEAAMGVSFARAQKLRDFLAQEAGADTAAVATTLMYVASDYMWGYVDWMNAQKETSGPVLAEAS